MNRVAKLIASIAASFAAGAIGSLATIPNIPTWYAALEKPFFNPPNWIFGPVWTILYILVGISLYLVWTSPSKKPKRTAYLLFGVQITLNTLWSIVFFGAHLPWAAVAIIIALLVTIIMTMKAFWAHSRWACWLLIPYIAWVSFATILNISIALLNN
jgi:benzodiazapine receptor